MDSIALLRQELGLAHWVLDVTMADVTQEQMDWSPPGVATPLGASYAHVLTSEDMIIGMLSGQAPLIVSTWAGKAGLSEPMPLPGPEWVNYAPWTRNVKVGLGPMREYGKAVQAATDEYLASLTPDDLDKTLDLSGMGMGTNTLGWALNLLVIGHINNITGEISCLKGMQGAKGYPF